MSLFEIVYTYLVYLVPFLFIFVVYLWFFRKAWRMQRGPWKWLLLSGTIAGCAYSLFLLVRDLAKPVADVNFNFTVIVVNGVAFVLLAICMAAGEPEK